jgi:hypothetical protein
MPRFFETVRVDRSAIGKAPLSQQGHDHAYWLKQTPRKRLEALELMRQLNYDYNPDTARLSRRLGLAKRKAR